MGGIKIRRKEFMADNPAIGLPLYTSSKGLTIASQFAARFDSEEALLNLVYELEKVRPSTDRWPKMSAHTVYSVAP